MAEMTETTVINEDVVMVPKGKGLWVDAKGVFTIIQLASNQFKVTKKLGTGENFNAAVALIRRNISKKE
jgi:hypothetical protein